VPAPRSAPGRHRARASRAWLRPPDPRELAPGYRFEPSRADNHSPAVGDPQLHAVVERQSAKGQGGQPPPRSASVRSCSSYAASKRAIRRCVIGRLAVEPEPAVERRRTLHVSTQQKHLGAARGPAEVAARHLNGRDCTRGCRRRGERFSSASRVEPGALVGAELEVDRVKALLELVDRRGADERDRRQRIAVRRPLVAITTSSVIPRIARQRPSSASLWPPRLPSCLHA
jgi:hypothetical protein